MTNNGEVTNVCRFVFFHKNWGRLSKVRGQPNGLLFFSASSCGEKEGNSALSSSMQAERRYPEILACGTLMVRSNPGCGVALTEAQFKGGKFNRKAILDARCWKPGAGILGIQKKINKQLSRMAVVAML